MAKGNHSISGTLTTKILSPGDDVVVSSISIANTHDTDSVTVNLYAERCSVTTYLIKNVVMPTGTTLVIDGEAAKIYAGRNSRGTGLYVKLGAASSTADVILKTI